MKHICSRFPATGKILLTVFLCSFFQVLSVYAQQSANPVCPTTERHQTLMQSKYERQIYDDVQRRLKAYKASGGTHRTNAVDQVYTIPVVVHIIQPADSMLKKQQVLDGIANLNKAFRNQFVESDGVDTKIQFQLANRTPDCLPTRGINYIDRRDYAYTNYGVTSPGGQGLSYQELYTISNWNNLEYYNIWVVNFMDYGVAQSHFPTGGYAPNDGTIIAASYFNTKTLAHELGHALNLWHTFARGIGEGDLGTEECPLNTNCAEQGDGCCDTEPVNQSANYLCPGDPMSGNPCNNNNPYGNVLKNYMGYGYFSCLTQFTNDQRTRMRSALEVLRPTLINSNKLDPVVPAQTIPNGTTATLTATGCTAQMRWYDAMYDGNQLGVGSTFTTPVLLTSTTYYAYCDRADCPAQDRMAVRVTVAPALPVHLISFNAERTDQNQVILNWATSFETSHDHFDVESANDAKTFKTAGSVFTPYRLASGVSEYRFTDITEPAEDLVYYRLKQVDTDGSFAYSKTVSVGFPEGAGVTVGPNPADHKIMVKGVGNNWDIEMFNAGGKIVLRSKNQREIDTKGLPSGLYLLRITLQNGHSITRKVVKK